MKVIHMHHLALNFGGQIVKEAVSMSCQKAFGRKLRCIVIYLGKMPGWFTKYMINTGQLCLNQDNECGKKSVCQAHFPYEESQ